MATGWTIPPNTATDCVILPIIKSGQVTNLGDIPFQGEAITPTCDPTKLSTRPRPIPPTPTSTSLAARSPMVLPVDAQHATTFLFVAGIKGGLFNRAQQRQQSAVGGDAGKVNGPQNYYSDIPEGQKLTNAAVSPDGMFAIATSIRRAQAVYACLNPLGDPGDPNEADQPELLRPAGLSVKCMVVGSNNLAADLTTTFGPDNQPYFGGQRIVNSFDSQPGGPFKSAWPKPAEPEPISWV